MAPSKKIIWVKVPSDMPMDQMDNMSQILIEAFKDSDFGFFIVPDRFDILSRNEVIEFLEQAVSSLKDGEF